jgi:hypothetical protein
VPEGRALRLRELVGSDWEFSYIIRQCYIDVGNTAAVDGLIVSAFGAPEVGARRGPGGTTVSMSSYNRSSASRSSFMGTVCVSWHSPSLLINRVFGTNASAQGAHESLKSAEIARIGLDAAQPPRVVLEFAGHDVNDMHLVLQLALDDR